LHSQETTTLQMSRPRYDAAISHAEAQLAACNGGCEQLSLLTHSSLTTPAALLPPAPPSGHLPVHRRLPVRDCSRGLSVLSHRHRVRQRHGLLRRPVSCLPGGCLLHCQDNPLAYLEHNTPPGKGLGQVHVMQAPCSICCSLCFSFNVNDLPNRCLASAAQLLSESFLGAISRAAEARQAQRVARLQSNSIEPPPTDYFAGRQVHGLLDAPTPSPSSFKLCVLDCHRD
jgi:hypothetical protein